MAAFRFALQAASAASPAAWRDLARKAEDLGYSTLYVPDHLDDQWAPMIAVTVAAEATTTLRVGTLVLDNDFRHPVLVAKEAATLDIVTGGRFEFGLGAGWMKTDYEQSGIPMDEPAVRVARLAESLAIMRAMWRDGSATYKGEHYQVTEAAGTPVPVTPGGPPLGDRRRKPACARPGRGVRRHRQRRAEPQGRLHRHRGGGGVCRREVRRPGALGPRGGGGACRRPGAAVLDGRGAGRAERRRGRQPRWRHSST